MLTIENPCVKILLHYFTCTVLYSKHLDTYELSRMLEYTFILQANAFGYAQIPCAQTEIEPKNPDRHSNTGMHTQCYKQSHYRQPKAYSSLQSYLETNTIVP